MTLLTVLLQAAEPAAGNDSTAQIAKAIVHDIATGEGFDKLTVFLKQLFDWGVMMGGRVIAALIIFVIGRFLIRLIDALFNKVLKSRKVDVGVASFLRSFIKTLMMVLLLVSIISKLGVETTSFAALLASFGVAIGMAMSGNLSNFVGGMLILIFKPYRVGETIEVNGIEGVVMSIEMFHTVLRTATGSHVYMANGSMSTATVKNNSRDTNLRLDFTVGVEYGEDIDRVENVMLSLAKADARVQNDPAPVVLLTSLSASSVDVCLRVWVKKEDYWSVKFDMNRHIYDTFNREGISFPYPQITVHQG